MNPSVARGSAWEEPVDRGEGHISVMIPYWIYSRVCNALTAMGADTKPEDYIVAVLEGHVRRLNV